MLVEILRDGIEILRHQPKQSWWMVDDATDLPEERTRVGLSEFDSCIRKLWYVANKVPRSDSTVTDMNVVWWIGNFVENVMVRGLEAAGLPIHDRQTELAWNGYTGHMDGTFFSDDHPKLIEEFGAGKHLMFEAKSAKPDKVKQVIKKGVREVFPQYYMQIQMYFWAYFETFGKHLDGAVILIGNKAPNFPNGASADAWYEEYIPRDEMVAPLQMQYVDMMLKQDTVPDRPYDKYVGLCPLCPFRSRCWPMK